MLRYPQNYGLDNDVDDAGWVDLVKVLPLPLFGRASAADIKTVVKERAYEKNRHTPAHEDGIRGLP